MEKIETPKNLYCETPPTVLRNRKEKFRTAKDNPFWIMIATYVFGKMVKARFHSLMYKGIDFVEQKATNWQRYQILQKIFYLHELDKYDFLELAESWEDDLYMRVGDSLAAGEEGMVIKAKDGIFLYIPVLWRVYV